MAVNFFNITHSPQKIFVSLTICLLAFSSALLSSTSMANENETRDPLYSASGAFYSNQYRNVFAELDIANEQQTAEKIVTTYQQLFYSESRSEEGESIFFPVGDDMGFIKDIGDDDIRSEGMSYGMMIAVQMGDQTLFNKLWKFAKTYMQHQDGWYQDYFAWHLSPNAPYNYLSENPAPDGELFFAMALFFAEGHWGAGEGIYQYRVEANKILQAMTDKVETNSQVTMFSRDQKQILFVTEKSAGIFTDPSYHVAAFYSLFARWADKDKQLWMEAAKVSRDFLYNTSHPVTGLYPDYAAFDGTPQVTSYNPNSHKSAYDAFRVIANMAMDYHWFNIDPRQTELADRLINFYAAEYQSKGQNFAVHELDGTIDSVWGSAGQNATNGTAAMMTNNQYAKEFAQRLWEQETPTGKWRYYDGLLHLFALLQMSGHYKIHGPTLGNTPGAYCN